MTKEPIATAPKDGTLIALEVVGGGFPIADCRPGQGWWTIGMNNFENDDEDVWHFVGWCWAHDHFVDTRELKNPGEPVAWRAFLDE